MMNEAAACWTGLSLAALAVLVEMLDQARRLAAIERWSGAEIETRR